MHLKAPRCIKVADGNARCPLCPHLGVKNGKSKIGYSEVSKASRYTKTLKKIM
jgi:hypothetical protein